MALLVAGCGGSTAAPERAAPKTVTVTASPSTSDVFGNGMFTVPQDVAPGTYKTAGPAADGDGWCYVALLSEPTHTAIITSKASKKPLTLTVSSTVGGVESRGCRPWVRDAGT